MIKEHPIGSMEFYIKSEYKWEDFNPRKIMLYLLNHEEWPSIRIRDGKEWIYNEERWDASTLLMDMFNKDGILETLKFRFDEKHDMFPVPSDGELDKKEFNKNEKENEKHTRR